MGSAFVALAISLFGNALGLELVAEVIPIAAAGHVFTLQANAPKMRAVLLARDALSIMLWFTPCDLWERLVWINTGNEELLVPLVSRDAVARRQPEPRLAQRHSKRGGHSVFAAKRPLPLSSLVWQGDRVGRHCCLRLSVDEAGAIFLAGRAIELGTGMV